MLKKLLFSILLSIPVILLGQPKPIALWKDISGMKHQKTKLYVYQAPDSIATGVSVIVCPGGSYSHLMGIATEGYAVAEWLNTQGITAFVLRYRVGSKGYHHPAMIQDAQRAIHYVRHNAAKYNINPAKLGTMGFSAGGHLVTMTGAFFNDNYLSRTGVPDDISLKPAFVVPVYPVVSMQDSIAHQRSRKNLLTRRYTKALQDRFSMELQIHSDMPPTFVVTAKDDPVVMYQNSVLLDQALTRANVPHRYLLYETGGHGYGMSEEIAGETAKWRYEFIQWLKDLDILK